MLIQALLGSFQEREVVYKKETPSSKSQKSNFGGNARFYVAYIQEIWGNEVAERVRNKIEARWQSPEYYYKDFFFFLQAMWRH